MSEIGGMNIQKLVETHGTPLVVYDEGILRDKLASFTDYFKSDSFETTVIYASKAFNCKAMISLIHEYGCSLDVVSGGELYTAYKAGYDCSKIFFHGNNKTPAEIKMALDFGVGTFIIDNEMEAAELVQQIQGTDRTVNVLLRVNPGIEAHTHEYIVTAHVDSKFGIAMLDEEEIVNVIKMLDGCDNITYEGLHAHIGSQIFDKAAYAELVRKMFAFAAKLKSEYGIDGKSINLGGGFAALYTDQDHPIPIDEVCAEILNTCEEENQKIGNQIRRICIEPGDEVLVPDPGYVSYAPCVPLAGGTPVPLTTKADNGFRIDPESLERAITLRTKALIFPYPNNPTGAVMRKEHLEALAPVIERHDLLVISDEIYAELTYEGSMPARRSRWLRR